VSFRARLLAAFTFAALLPLVLITVGVRRQISTRLASQYDRRLQARLRLAKGDLDRQSAAIAVSLGTLTRGLALDDRFRMAAVRGAPEERAYLLDLAAGAMRATGLSMLQVQDENGRIISSGHFRNEFDRLEPALPRLLGEAVDGALVRARAPEGTFLAFARVDSARVGGRVFYVVGGVLADTGFLGTIARDDGLSAVLRTPDDMSHASEHQVSADSVTNELPLKFIDTRVADSAVVAPARLILSQSLSDLHALQGTVNNWFLVALALVVAAVFGMAVWLSARLSEPLAELARATSAIELDGPEVTLAAARDDEIGTLARRFGTMASRLRTNAARLRESERRATIGDMARQVNHDIKNGLIPIRNVLHHLADVQEGHPDQLGQVFAERRGTLESSLSYLDTLARNYARLTPRVDLTSVDVNAIVRDVVRGAASAPGVRIGARLADGLPALRGDPVVLRRILDNLVRNGVESLGSAEGTVTIETSRGENGTVRLVVSDTGCGMSPDELQRVFTNFYTTKESGTGLGLSVVRRLTNDLQGAVRVHSAAGRGTSVTIELPTG
jgi:signal transduction histidine kinase